MAGDVAEDPLLQSLIEDALAHNPGLAASRGDVRALEARGARASLREDPELTVLYTNDGWSPSLGEQEMTTLAFVGRVPLSSGQTRRLRGEIAVKEAGQAGFMAERERLRVVASVKRAYWDLVLAREILGIAGEQAEVWRQTEGVARARYAVGQGTQSDVLRAQVERTRVAQQQAEQAAEVDRAVAALEFWVGQPVGDRVASTPRLALRPVAGPLEGRMDAALAQNPEQKAALLGVAKESLAVELASREGRPATMIEAGYMNRGGLDPMWQAGVTLSLPFRRARVRSSVAEAEARRQAEDSRRRRTMSELVLKTRELLAELEAAEARARLYADGIIPQGQIAVEAAIANYQSGGVPFVAALEAIASLYADRADHSRIAARHHRLLADLEETAGAPMEEGRP
jgi:outer membrane protein TolC